MSIVTNGIDHDRLEMSCPCCYMSCVQPDKVSCVNCEEDECEEQGGSGEHNVVPFWYERADIHCINCGCIYDLVLCGENKIAVNWSCDADDSIECKCCDERRAKNNE